MKLNLVLSILLISLVTTAYFTEELAAEAKKRQQDTAEQLYDASRLGALQGLATPAAKILKGGDYYYTAGDYRIADPQIVDKVFEILSHIRARRHLSESELGALDRKELFPSTAPLFTFYFENGELTYLLGKKLDFDRSFYMEISNSVTKKTQTVIAFDETADEGAYPEEVFHRTAEKYNRLHNILQLPESFYHDLHVLRKTSVEQLMTDWKTIDIESLRNPFFSIDLQQKKTKPAIYSGLSYRLEQYDLVLKNLVQLKAKQLIAKGDRRQLKELDFSYVITKKSGKQERIDIYRQFLGQPSDESWFLITTFSDDIFVMDQAQVNSIRLHHQDFWNLTFAAHSASWPMIVDFNFSIQELSMSLELHRRGGFLVKIPEQGTLEPIQSSFKKLFEMVGKTATYAQVVNQERDDSKQLGQQLLDLELLGQHYTLYRNAEDLILLNVQLNVALVYTGGAADFPQTAVDYFIQKGRP